MSQMKTTIAVLAIALLVMTIATTTAQAHRFAHRDTTIIRGPHNTFAHREGTFVGPNGYAHRDTTVVYKTPYQSTYDLGYRNGYADHIQGHLYLNLALSQAYARGYSDGWNAAYGFQH